jgi:hypothetical protein
MRPLALIRSIRSIVVAAALMACVATSADAQKLGVARSYPSSANLAVGALVSDQPGGWLVFAVPSMLPAVSEPINAGAGVIWEGKPGKYLVLYFPPGQQFPQPEVRVVVLGVAAPPEEPDDPTDPPVPPEEPTDKVTQVTYVYEKDETAVPREVAKALGDINAKYLGVVASEFEDDTTAGGGSVPAQYRVALEAARKAGLPALVVQAGAKVVKVVKAPTTETQVTEALK